MATGTVRAAAHNKRGSKWRLAAHNYQLSCELRTKRASTGFGLKSAENAANRSAGKTVGRCTQGTVSSGTYVFSWSYDRKADRRGRAAGTKGEVEFSVKGGSVADILIRPMPYPQPR